MVQAKVSGGSPEGRSETTGVVSYLFFQYALREIFSSLLSTFCGNTTGEIHCV